MLHTIYSESEENMKEEKATVLMPEELKNKIKEYPIYSQDGLKLDAKVLVKYFNPYGAGTWLILEGQELDDGDFELYGYMNLIEWEYGYVLLSQLERIKFCNRASIERDLYTKNETLGDFLKENGQLEEYKKIFMEVDE